LQVFFLELQLFFLQLQLYFLLSFSCSFYQLQLLFLLELQLFFLLSCSYSFYWTGHQPLPPELGLSDSADGNNEERFALANLKEFVGQAA
jgi:hypothetical protein